MRWAAVPFVDRQPGDILEQGSETVTASGTGAGTGQTRTGGILPALWRESQP